jgi:hypothetical protein
MNENPEDNLDILGHKVVDKVTKFKGTATSVCFDLYGCIQVSVCSTSKKGANSSVQWFDIDRLDRVGDTRVMEPPTQWVTKGCQSERPTI